MAVLKNNKKIQENKEEKENKLLSSALKLFTEKGVKDTSVQEITAEAGVAKGTFYLYFKDKYEIQDYLIARKSKQLFDSAIKKLNKQDIKDYKEKIVFIIDYIIDELSKNKLLLKFISKNLSWGVYNDKIAKLIDDDNIGIQELFLREIENNNIKIEYPEIKLFLIIELVSGTIFSSIMNSKPLPIKELKPYLYDEIRGMLS
jgi:AcrR family transcriptional regulator